MEDQNIEQQNNFWEPLKLDKSERLIFLKYFLISLILGSSYIWIPVIIRSAFKSNDYNKLTFVLNGNLLSFIIVVIIERCVNLIKYQSQIHPPNNSGKTKKELKNEINFEKNSDSIVNISITIGFIISLISICLYMFVVFEIGEIVPLAQWIVFISGVLIWFYLICLLINKRWRDIVNGGYTLEKDKSNANAIKSESKLKSSSKDDEKL